MNATTSPAIARAVESETLRLGSGTLHLLLDSSATGGVLSVTPRASLGRGRVRSEPARPHQDQRDLLRAGREHRRAGRRRPSDRDRRRPRRGAAAKSSCLRCFGHEFCRRARHGHARRPALRLLPCPVPGDGAGCRRRRPFRRHSQPKRRRHPSTEKATWSSR